MDIGAILVGIAMLALVGAYVARPLLERQPGRSRRHAAGPRAQLTTSRDAIYALIRELDADHQTGKINDEDYQAQRERCVAQGVSLLKQLDAMSGDGKRAAQEAEIEAAVLALRQKPGVSASGAAKPALSRFCVKCGHPTDPENNFCGGCGAPLKEAAFQ